MITQEEAIKLIVKLSEGNPGAMTVMVDLYKERGDDGLDIIVNEPNLRGCAIWLVYKDYGTQDLKRFDESIREWKKDGCPTY